MDNQNNNYNMPEEHKAEQHQTTDNRNSSFGYNSEQQTEKIGYNIGYNNQRTQYGSGDYNSQTPNYTYTYDPNITASQKKSGMPGWAKALLIIAAVLIFAVILGAACSRAIKSAFEVAPSYTDSYIYTSDYIGVLFLEGTIADGESGDGYNHNWMLTRISDMAKDPLNKGIVLYVETPGGSSYASRELYLELLNYKNSTNRPLYVYMGSQATSGGYYAAVAADRIYANEECWTGSIGVIISGLYDLSGLFDKYGIHAENITSGKNKDMGTNIKPLTDDQRAILQGLVDDTFDRFVQAVVDGRKMSESKVRELADGRIYAANQALENGLIDAIGTIDDAVFDMQDKYELGSAEPQLMQYTPPTDLRSYLGFNAFNNSSSKSLLGQLIAYGQLVSSGESGTYDESSPRNTSDISLSDGDLSALVKLLEDNGTFEIMCIAPVRK